jgi:hypothetical protein
MDQELIARFRDQAIAVYKKTRVWTAKVPLTGWIVGGFFCIATLLMALHTAMSAKDASLRLKVQHSFRSAQLQVWVDSDLAYSGRLVGYGKKRLGFIPDAVQGTLSETLEVPSGSHKVKIRVSADDGTAQEDTTMADFVRNSQRTLSVTARHSDLSLNWQGSTAAIPDPPPASSGWFARYASTLILTAAGSIISALTGYLLRELPIHIRARQSAAGQVPKA